MASRAFHLRALVLGAAAIFVVAIAIAFAMGRTRAHAPRHRPKSARALPTTSADIWLENLDGQISELTRILGEAPALVANVQRLSAAHHLRGRYRGDLDEIQLGIDEATRCIALEPTHASCVMMRAEQEQSLHRFAAARADLERARALGIEPARAADLEAELDWNDGRYERAIETIRRARRERPSSTTWLREGQLEHDLGREREADLAFDAAEDAITDVSPLPVAHLNVQRGIRESQRGRLEDACVYFREAVARMPGYVAANEHLAEALHMLGKDDDATAIYEKVVAASDDPEFAHALAELYAARGRNEESRVLAARASAGYERLLAKYPEAMYWHASEFYRSIGDRERARELLRKNLTLRPNSVSYVALARAELDAGDVTAARTAIDQALAMPVVSADLYATAAAVARATGDVARADAYVAKARAINPRVP